jgi:hypothetical protein
MWNHRQARTSCQRRTHSTRGAFADHPLRQVSLGTRTSLPTELRFWLSLLLAALSTGCVAVSVIAGVANGPFRKPPAKNLRCWPPAAARPYAPK